jgi:hypothetical protein
MDVIRAHDFYGAIVRSAVVGPRQELMLSLETWPKGSHKFAGGPIVAIRFGAIENFEEVQRFAAAVPQSGLHYLRHTPESKPGRHIVEMEFDRTGERFMITARHLSGGNTSSSV